MRSEEIGLECVIISVSLGTHIILLPCLRQYPRRVNSAPTPLFTVSTSWCRSFFSPRGLLQVFFSAELQCDFRPIQSVVDRKSFHLILFQTSIKVLNPVALLPRRCFVHLMAWTCLGRQASPKPLVNVNPTTHGGYLLPKSKCYVCPPRRRIPLRNDRLCMNSPASVLQGKSL